MAGRDRDFIKVVARDRALRSQLVAAATQDNNLQVEEILKLLRKFQDGGQLVDTRKLVEDVAAELPALAAYFMLDLSQLVIEPSRTRVRGSGPFF